jgi:hypothetical protein
MKWLERLAYLLPGISLVATAVRSPGTSLFEENLH